MYSLLLLTAVRVVGSLHTHSLRALSVFKKRLTWSRDISRSVGRSINISWGVSISLPRDGQVPVARSEDAGIRVTCESIVEDSPPG